MKFYVRAFSFYVTMLILSIIFYSCCKDMDYLIVGEGQITMERMELGEYDSYEISPFDTIDGPFYVHLVFEVDLISELEPTGGIINSAYGFERCTYPTFNPIDTSSIQIMLDQAIVLNGVEIPAFTDIHDSVEFWNSQYDGPRIDFSFNEETLNQIQFSNQVYTFYFNMKTLNDLEISYEFPLFMDL